MTYSGALKGGEEMIGERGPTFIMFSTSHVIVVVARRFKEVHGSLRGLLRSPY